jgi:hypothetical protein
MPPVPFADAGKKEEKKMMLKGSIIETASSFSHSEIDCTMAVIPVISGK